MLIKPPTRRELLQYGGGSLLALQNLNAQGNRQGLLTRFASAAASPPALITHAIQSTSVAALPATTTGVDTTGANLIVLACTDNFGGATPTDSKSNTWTGLTIKRSMDTNLGIRIFYCAAPSVGTSHTFTNGAFAPSIAMLAFSNMNASPFDVQNGNDDTSSSPNTQPGSVTPSINNSVIVVFQTDTNGNIKMVSINSSFTFVESSKVDGQAAAVGSAYLIQNPATAINPTTTTDFSSTEKISVIASFKPA